MLETLSRLAVHLSPLRHALTIALALLAAVAALAVFNPDMAMLQSALPAIVAGLLWALCGIVFIHAFATVPPPPPADLRGASRLLRRINRGFHWLLFIIFAGITAAALLLTARLINDL
jgi:fatty acid desaturase